MSFMLSVIYAECRKKNHYAECLNAECRYAGCLYVECRYTRCRSAECRGAIHIATTESFDVLQIYIFI